MVTGGLATIAGLTGAAVGLVDHVTKDPEFRGGSPLAARRNRLVENVTSMGFDLQKLQNDGLLAMDHVNVAPGDLAETGAWDLSGLFIRLGAAIDEVGAKRVVLDTIETLFGAFDDSATLRSELRRLFTWLKERLAGRPNE